MLNAATAEDNEQNELGVDPVAVMEATDTHEFMPPRVAIAEALTHDMQLQTYQDGWDSDTTATAGSPSQIEHQHPYLFLPVDPYSVFCSDAIQDEHRKCLENLWRQLGGFRFRIEKLEYYPIPIYRVFDQENHESGELVMPGFPMHTQGGRIAAGQYLPFFRIVGDALEYLLNPKIVPQVVLKKLGDVKKLELTCTRRNPITDETETQETYRIFSLGEHTEENKVMELQVDGQVISVHRIEERADRHHFALVYSINTARTPLYIDQTRIRVNLMNMQINIQNFGKEDREIKIAALSEIIKKIRRGNYEDFSHIADGSINWNADTNKERVCIDLFPEGDDLALDLQDVLIQDDTNDSCLRGDRVRQCLILAGPGMAGRTQEYTKSIIESVIPERWGR